MGSHVGFDKGGATDLQSLLNPRFERGFVGYVLVEHQGRSGLRIFAAHHDETVFGESGAPRKSEGGRKIARNSMPEVGLWASVLNRKFLRFGRRGLRAI